MSNSDSNRDKADGKLLQTIKSLPNQVFRYRRNEEGEFVITFSEGGVAEGFGKTDRITGKTLREVFGEGAREKYGEYCDRAFNGETVRFETKQGSRWFLNVVSPLSPKSEESPPEIVGYSFDITERKKAERRFSLAQQFADVGTWEYSFEDESLYWNSECERLFNLEEGEFEGTYDAFLKRVHPEDRDYVRSETEGIVQEKEVKDIEFEHRIIREDGEIRWVRELAQPVAGEHEKTDRVIGMVMDVTDRKKAEEKLKESEEKYRAIVEKSHDGIYIQRKNQFLLVNEKICDILGYSKEELYEKSVWDLLHPDDVEYVKDIGEKRASGEQAPAKYQAKAITKGGDVVHLSFSVTSISYEGEYAALGSVRDITEEIRAEKELRKSKERFEDLANLLPQPLWETDTDGEFTYVNEAGYKKFGYSPADIESGVEITDVVATEHHDKLKNNFSKALEGVEREDHEYTCIAGDGREFPALIYSSPIVDEGEIKGVRGITLDITERKLAQQKLEHRAKFENLLRELSGRFLETRSDDIDGIISEALADLGEFLKLDRTYVFKFDWEQEVMNNTHEWCARGVEPQREKLQNIPVSSLPSWMDKLENFEDIYISSVSDLSEDWESERKVLESQNIKSLIVVPISYGDNLLGFAGFDSVREKREWRQEEIDLLEVFGDLTGSALFTLRTKNELREREKKYRQIFNNANDAIYLHGIEEGMPGKFLEVNEIASEMLGYGRDELLSMSPLDIDAATNPDEMLQIMENLSEEGKETFEVEHRRKDGSLVPVEISAHFFQMNGEEVVLAIARDITERKKHQRELEQATIGTLHALNRTIESKDEYTGGHIDRVQDFSVALGEKLELSDERLEQLRYASILHDVGKIGIDDSILGKPGSLTDEEWEEMEKHPKIGERIVGQVDRLEKAARIIGQHQEQYNGSGYPAGLQEEEITLEARIIAVVDAWDAMRTDRPYRDALSREEAKRELKENAGTQFDPEIVDLFLEMIEEERLELN